MFNFIARRQLLRQIALDRICYLSDIGRKDLSFDIRSTERVRIHSQAYSGPAKVFRVQFFYSDPRVLEGNPLTYAGEIYEVDTVHNCTWLEEEIAEKIRAIKSQPARDSQ